MILARLFYEKFTNEILKLLFSNDLVLISSFYIIFAWI